MFDSPFFVFLVYLLYGGAFFAIGIAIVTRLKTFTKLRIAGLFWLLAAFAFSHSLHEWFELFLHLEAQSGHSLLGIRQFSLLLLLSSFLFLAFFAINLHRVLHPATLPWLYGLLLVPTGFFLWLLFSHKFLVNDDFLRVVDFSIRKLLALPATLLTGVGFMLYSRRLRLLSRRGAGNFAGTGLAFLVYGIFTGVFPSDAVVFQLPIQFWRGLTAFFILHFLMYGLHIFLDEREAQISERLRRSAQEEKLGAIGRLAAGIAHEINNPLANAAMQLELLLNEPSVSALPGKSIARIEAVERGIEKSARIAGELLLLAGRQQDSIDYNLVELREVLNTAWRELAAGEFHRLQNNLPSSLVVYGQELKLEQLFRNLLLNSVDAMPDGGVITVYGSEADGRIVVRLLDQGQGISSGEGDLLLEPFFTTKEVGKGTGLGLAICCGIMAQHQGTLEITSREGRQGAMVTLSFPGAVVRKREEAVSL